MRITNVVLGFALVASLIGNGYQAEKISEMKLETLNDIFDKASIRDAIIGAKRDVLNGAEPRLALDRLYFEQVGRNAARENRMPVDPRAVAD